MTANCSHSTEQKATLCRTPPPSQCADRAKKALATIPTEHGKPLDALRPDERTEAITVLIADLLLYGARDELDPAIVLEDAALIHDSVLALAAFEEKVAPSYVERERKRQAEQQGQKL